MTGVAISKGVFGVFAFLLWTVTYHRVNQLEARIQALEQQPP